MELIKSLHRSELCCIVNLPRGTHVDLREDELLE